MFPSFPLSFLPVDHIVADDGAPAVDGRSGAADGVGNHSAKPMEVAPSREEVRSGGGGGTEFGGDGGERGARREHESDGESER